MGNRRLLYQISTAVVVVLFGVAGLLKVVPGISPETHNELSGKFRSYVQVPPIHLLRLRPELYMLLVGGTELACVGLILFARSGLISQSHPELVATWVLLLIVVGAIYTHISISDRVPDMAFALVGLAAVLIRLYIMGALDDVRVKVKV